MSDALDEQRVRAFIAGTLPLEIKTMLRSKGFVRRAQRTAASAGPGGILTVWGRSDDSAIRCAKNGFPPNTR